MWSITVNPNVDGRTKEADELFRNIKTEVKSLTGRPPMLSTYDDLTGLYVVLVDCEERPNVDSLDTKGCDMEISLIERV